MEIHSVQDYITLLEKLKELYTYDEPIAGSPTFGTQIHIPEFIYRGHGRKSYKLLPGILRTKNLSEGTQIAEYAQVEYNILNDFIAETCRFVRNIPENDIPAQLEIAQHFGAPTRLLDFTENPLVALYFACCEANEEDACVWIVNNPEYFRWLQGIPTVVLESTSRAVVDDVIRTQIVGQYTNTANNGCVQSPWIYKPHYREERMNMQASVFMLWGWDNRPLTEMICQADIIKDVKVDNREHGLIGCIEIQAKDKKTILKQLSLCGISEKYIYPGIDGAGKYIKGKYSYPR